MNGEVRTQGIVLLTAPCGEYDRRLVVLTAERGRITVFARGARRPGNSFSACTQSFTFAVFTLYEGREAYTLKSAERTRFFEELRDDPVRACYGMYFCEMAMNCAREGMDEEELMKLLYLALSALAKNVIDKRLVRAAFELRCIAIFGEAPLTQGTHYSRNGSGLTEGEENVSPDTLNIIKYIITAPLKNIFTFSVPQETIDELSAVSSDWSEYRIGRQLKSKEILKVFEEAGE